MPGLAVHTYVDRLLFGRSYWRVHREMDRPYKYLGKHHRVLFHDPLLAYAIARKQYPNDSNAVAAAQCHILLDNMCSRNPKFKKMLTLLAKRSRKRKKRRQETLTTSPRVRATKPMFDGLRQLTNLLNSSAAVPVDPFLIGLVAESLRRLMVKKRRRAMETANKAWEITYDYSKTHSKLPRKGGDSMGKRCPRCRRNSMRPAGKIRAGPRGGLRSVFRCTRCGYRSIR